MVVFAEPTQAYRLGFALGVQLFVERAEGLTLFQQRGPSIGRDPLLWTASASGGLGHREQPRDAVLADAAEEIGLGGGSPRVPAGRGRVSDDTGPRSSSTTRCSARGPSPSRTPSRSPSCTGRPRPDEPGRPGVRRHGRLMGGARAVAGSGRAGTRASVGGIGGGYRSSEDSPPVTFSHQSSSRRFSSPCTCST